MENQALFLFALYPMFLLGMLAVITVGVFVTRLVLRDGGK